MREIATTHNTHVETWKNHNEAGPYVVTSARVLAGNMSPAYNQLGEDLNPDEKKQRAGENVEKFLESAGLKPENAFIMLPQQKWPEELGAVEVDAVFTPGQESQPVVGKDRADLLITRNEETILACRPADCPVVTIQGIDTQSNEPVLALLHVGWQGLNAGYFEKGIKHLVEQESVDLASMRLQMSGAGYAENFLYTNKEDPYDDESRDGENPKRFTHPEREHLFVNREEKKDAEGNVSYAFAMDMPGFIRHQAEKLGLKPEQLYEEGSDTSQEDSGYSSHRRDGKYVEEIDDRKVNKRNTRDMVVATMSQPDQALIMRAYQRSQGTIAAHAAGITLHNTK